LSLYPLKIDSKQEHHELQLSYLYLTNLIPNVQG